MLEMIDESPERFLRGSLQLGATDVDVSFEAPDREWSAKLTRPTVNLFRWDIRRSATRSRSGMCTVEAGDDLVHPLAFRIVELGYVITAWTSDHGDERALFSCWSARSSRPIRCRRSTCRRGSTVSSRRAW